METLYQVQRFHETDRIAGALPRVLVQRSGRSQ